MSFWNAANFERLTNGRWLADAIEQTITGVNTDTRAVRAGQCFIALAGEHHDAHNYLAQAFESGATVALVERDTGFRPARGGLLLVSSTKKAMAQLAAAYRDHLGSLGATIFAVCGSNGKTTTVRLLSAALSSLQGTASQKSFNNDIGVPTTLLSAREGDRYVICEVGSNAPGEIDTLGAIVRPDIAIITSIGREHLLGFGSIEGVMREESSIARHIRPGGHLFTADVPGLVAHLPSGSYTRIIADASALRNVRHENINGDVGLAWDDEHGRAWRLPLGGSHNASNATLAIRAARLLKLDDSTIQAGLLCAKGPEMRLQRLTIGPLTVINDAYNANPESMLASLGAFTALTPAATKRAVVLGDMFELGEATGPSHAEVLAAARANQAIRTVITLGKNFAALNPNGEPEPTAEAIERIIARIGEHDAVLLKGSRGMRLERLLPMIEKHFAAATSEGEAR